MSVTFSGSNHNQMRTVTFASDRSFEVAASVHLTDAAEGDHNDPRWLNLCNGNAVAFLGLLGFNPAELWGEASVPEIHRAIIKARATFERRASSFARREDVEYGKPRTNEDGTVELRPVRVHRGGLSTDRLAQYLDRLLVLTAALEARGATHITWG